MKWALDVAGNRRRTQTLVLNKQMCSTQCMQGRKWLLRESRAMGEASQIPEGGRLITIEQMKRLAYVATSELSYSSIIFVPSPTGGSDGASGIQQASHLGSGLSEPFPSPTPVLGLVHCPFVSCTWLLPRPPAVRLHPHGIQDHCRTRRGGHSCKLAMWSQNLLPPQARGGQPPLAL